MREAIEIATRRAVQETFRLLGVDMADQDAINRLRDDLSYVRALRETGAKRRDETRAGVLRSAFQVGLTALLAAGAAVWAMLGFKTGGH